MEDATETSTGGTSGDGDGDSSGSDGLPDMGDGVGDGGFSPCNVPLDPCPNNDCGVDGRRNIANMDCGTNGCSGLWSGSDAWTPMRPAGDLANMPAVDPSTVWGCDTDPDVDACVVVDANGHVGCFRIEGPFAVPVWPACAGAQSGIDAGNGMCVSAD
jgi:hypothetical protein